MMELISTRTKFVNDLMKSFRTTEDHVMFCILISQGVDEVDAYRYSFKMIGSNIEKCEFDARNLKKNPKTKNIIQELRLTDKSSGGNKKSFRTKEAVVEELEKVYPHLPDKDKPMALIKIATLQQMDKEEIVDEEERVHFFLPLRCSICPYKEETENKKKKTKTKEE